MTRARTIAACHASVSFSDLLHRFGKLVETEHGKIARIDGGGARDSNLRPLEGLYVDATVRQLSAPVQPYDEARAAAYRADWQETDRLMDEAWQAFMQHGDRHRYKADCRRVIERKAP
jgi:hypothetical protein